MKWIEITVKTEEAYADAISDFLMDLGAGGTELVDPGAFRQVLEANRYLDYADDGFIDSYGSDVLVRAYFPDGTDPESIAGTVGRKLRELSAVSGAEPGAVEWKIRDDSEWKDNWKEYFKPFNITPSVVIKPSWEKYEPRQGETVIEIDPGMAFGTGTHETTRMCASLGEKYLRPGDQVLDLGCGTAILAVMAAKMGAAGVLAVDIDEAAVKTARENVLKNYECERIRVMRGVLADVPEQPFDLIYMNIIADVIISLSGDVRRYVREGSRVILSGIIKSRRDEVVSRYAECGFRLGEETAVGEWVAMLLYA